MKWKYLLQIFSVAVFVVLYTDCKGPMGNRDIITEVAPDSDRPAWAGGNTEDNPHNKKGDGGTNGGNTVDYGNLYVLLRDLDGVPEMLNIPVVDEEGVPTGEEIWVVQPIAEDGRTLELDAEGEIMPEELGFAQPVDFGRLNIVRSPQSVFDQAMGEVLKVVNAGEKFSVDFCGRLTIWNTVDGVLSITKTIDSPRENLAMYQEIMNYRFTNKLGKLVGWEIDPITLAASCFAAGSDKTGTVNIDEVVYINGFIDCLGCNPILNEHEYLKNNDNKYYFNFGDCDCTGKPFTYDRNVYKDRNLKITTLNSDGTWYVDYVSVWQAMEDRGLFRYRWAGILHQVDGFACAIDDAVQVLEFVHGNSNIEFVPVTP